MTVSPIFYHSNVNLLGSTEPTAPTVVFLHGLGADQSSWRHLLPAFRDKYRILLLDLIGSGNSDPAAYDYARHGTLQGHADDLLAVLHELGASEVVFVGHSVSAIIGLLAAVKEPARFSRLLLLSPSPRFANEGNYFGGFEHKDLEALLAGMHQDYPAWAAAVAPLMLNGDPSLEKELTQTMLGIDPAIAEHFARVTFLQDNRAALPHVRTPALILQCAHDSIVPPAVGQYLHRQLAQSELAVIDTNGHSMHLTAPQEALAAMRAFLQADPALALP